MPRAGHDAKMNRTSSVDGGRVEPGNCLTLPRATKHSSHNKNHCADVKSDVICFRPGEREGRVCFRHR